MPGATGATGATGTGTGSGQDELSQGVENAVGLGGAGGTPVHAQYVPMPGSGVLPTAGTGSIVPGTGGQPGVVGADGTIIVRADDGELLKISVTHLDPAHPGDETGRRPVR